MSLIVLFENIESFYVNKQKALYEIHLVVLVFLETFKCVAEKIEN